MFETDRLHLRAVREADIERLNALRNDQHVQKMLSPDSVVPWGVKGEAFIRTRVSESLYYLIIETKDKHEFIGFTSMFGHSAKNRDAYIALALQSDFRGRGYATEVLRFVVDYSFQQLAMHRVTLTVFGNNTAAIKVYNKVGFVQEGVQRKANWMDGEWQDVILMAVLDEDWGASKKEGVFLKSVS